MERYQTTDAGHRLHIVILGACNSGKSSVANLLTGESTSLVSDIAGTTTDAVSRAVELPGIGAAVITDTAGFDDDTELGASRIQLTERSLERADVALLLIGENEEVEKRWMRRLKEKKLPMVRVVNKCDLGRDVPEDAIGVSALRKEGRARLNEAIASLIPADFGEADLLRGLVHRGDNVILVMPQDSQAPKGRLIMPQVQTIRAILDKGGNALCTTPEELPGILASIKGLPDLVITDSQVFRRVSEVIPEGCRLTSFSVLMAAYKGDIDYFVESSEAIGTLRPGDRILIGEACAHAPGSEDIGRVKIPALINKQYGPGIEFDVKSGRDFPKDLTPYRVVIHCGACMFNRRLVLSRVEEARRQGVPMTNYGIAIACLTGILGKIVY
jgi:[FeFe] hydrogenase H-cluster maturation GTPase HydF